MSDHVDWAKAIKRVNLDLPVWAIKDLDKEADGEALHGNRSSRHGSLIA